MQLVELFLRDFAGGAHHEVLGALVHREGDYLADGVLSREEHDHAVHARGDARVRGRAVAEGVVHRGELGLHVLLAEVDELKGLYHDVRLVVAHRAGGELHAVAHEVVLVGGDGERVYLPALGGEQGGKAALRH